MTPQPGYIVSTLTVNSATQTPASTYTFANVIGGQTISATFALSPNTIWKQTHFGANANNPLIAGDLADPDGDGLFNLIEYATKMNPALNDLVPQSATKNGNVLDFIYTKNKAATDVTFVVEWSDTLGNDWSTTGVNSPTILSDNGTTQQIKVTVPAGSGVTRRFVRLRVTRP